MVTKARLRRERKRDRGCKRSKVSESKEMRSMELVSVEVVSVDVALGLSKSKSSVSIWCSMVRSCKVVELFAVIAIRMVRHESLD